MSGVGAEELYCKLGTVTLFTSAPESDGIWKAPSSVSVLDKWRFAISANEGDSLLVPTLRLKLSFGGFWVKCSEASDDKDGPEELGNVKLGIWNWSPSERFSRLGIWNSWFDEFMFTFGRMFERHLKITFTRKN